MSRTAWAKRTSSWITLLAIVRSRPFVTSTLIGATSMQQLRENLAGIELDAETIKAIGQIHARYPNPAP